MDNDRQPLPGSMYGFASHVGPLGLALAVTNGPVLELGMGHVSTPLLHWSCFPVRELLSIDESPQWLSIFRGLQSKLHAVKLVENWDSFLPSLGKKHWSVVFIDCVGQAEYVRTGDFSLRVRLVEHFAPLADIIVVHDTSEQGFNVPALWNRFTHIWTFKPEGLPWTTLASEKFDFLTPLGVQNNYQGEK